MAFHVYLYHLVGLLMSIDCRRHVQPAGRWLVEVVVLVASANRHLTQAYYFRKNIRRHSLLLKVR